MANTYFKMLNNSVQNKYTESIIVDVQNDLKLSARFGGANLYDMLLEIKDGNVDDKFDINTLLKFYVLNQLIKDGDVVSKENKTIEPEFIDTPNSNIKINKESNKYFRLINGNYEEADDIEFVYDDGSYSVIEQQRSSSLKIRKVYTVSDSILSVQLLDSFKNVIDNEAQVSELLGMKKEYAKKHKYSGISGQSSDLVASFLNKLTSPVETGCYMDKRGCLYKWNSLKKCFFRNYQVECKSPLLVDYEFKNNTVIRKEYTGIK